MKVNFNIMWVDDKPKDMKPIIDEIEGVLKENYFIPDIRPAFVSYKDFMAIFESSDGDDGSIFNDCDLLLIDYHIAQKAEDASTVTGEALIEQLRKKGVFTEVVFYSDDMKGYRSKSNKKELDNVTYADKSQLVDKVEHLIKKSVRQGMNISNLRGYIMDSTSEFDFVCKQVASHYFLYLNESQQKEILSQIERYVQEQYELESKRFFQNNSKYEDSYNSVKKLKDRFTLSAIENPKDRHEKFIAALDSQEYIMQTSKKFRVLANVLRMLNIECADEIYLFDSEGKTEHDIHKDFYQSKLIKPRNDFAHSRLLYGKHCGKKRIKIMTSLLDECIVKATCAQDDATCNKSYSYVECLNLRKYIYNYYHIFERLLSDVKEQLARV